MGSLLYFRRSSLKAASCSAFTLTCGFKYTLIRGERCRPGIWYYGHMYEVQEFKNGPLKANVRTLLIDGVVWFVLMDVARVFGYRDAGRVLHHLRTSQYTQADEPIKKALGVRGKSPYLVTEGGFYRLALQSTNEEAQPFQEWVEDEVLVTVRKAYSVGINVLEELKEQHDKRILMYQGQMDSLVDRTNQYARRNEDEIKLELASAQRKIDDAEYRAQLNYKYAGYLKEYSTLYGSLEGAMEKEEYEDKRFY